MTHGPWWCARYTEINTYKICKRVKERNADSAIQFRKKGTQKLPAGLLKASSVRESQVSALLVWSERERESLTRPMLCFVAWPRDSDFSCPSLSMMMIGVFLLASEWGNERNSMSNQQTSSITISTSYTGAIISYIITHYYTPPSIL